MKTMTCKQLGGPVTCDQEFHANNFDEIAEQSKKHAMEKAQQKDEAHLKAMAQMKECMKNPEDMNEWFENKKKEFEALPEDSN